MTKIFIVIGLIFPVIDMKPSKLEVKNTTESHNSASYLDIFLETDNKGNLSTRPYDKRDEFNIPITNFPFICGNIPASPAYGVYISQLIRYCRACSDYKDFIYRCQLLTTKLLLQDFQKPRLRASLKKFYGRYRDLIDHYEMSVSRLVSDLSLNQ